MTKLILALVISLMFCSNANAALVGSWNFNVVSGTTAQDNSAYGNNGYISPLLTWVPGKYGKALKFSLIPDAVVTIPNSSSLQLTNAFTVMAWVKPHSGGDRRIVEHALAGSAGFVLMEDYTPPGPQEPVLKWHVYFNGFSFYTNAQIQLDKFQHIAVTYDAVYLKFYVNGVLDSSFGIGEFNLTNVNEPWIIGGTVNDQCGCGWNDGIIDEVRIYNNPLTQDQVVTDMNANPNIGQPPIAEAGEDILAPENFTVTLDGSNSSDLDGTITNYVWKRLPDNVILCDSSSSTCETNTLGRAGEFIELTVLDSDGREATDSMSIYFKKAPVCGNTTVEPPEVCDGNSQSCTTTGGYPGTQSCNGQCSGFATCTSSLSCGDGIKNGSEVCDGNAQSCTTASGYSGLQACNGQCSGFGICTSSLFCGDHFKNGTEVCDGDSRSCTTTGGYVGSQSCNGQCTAYGTCASNLSCGDGICTAPPETASNCAQDCVTPIVIEAENMTTKTTGEPVTGGWLLKLNGYIENSVQFLTTGIYRIDIIAKGTKANNVWPNMEIRGNQSAVTSFTVNSTVWTTYTFQINVPQGTHMVAVAFTNDLMTLTEDRNLYVDKVMITKQ